ncbi:MAG: 16S rRNA (cytosine(967)-C(5))-methyltransferase RsmB [Acidobacteria bacterium]|nr:16S rRNA (cytosine(967)-C(5))-methyltransferase RsmB [Acidobacteriota bacterium]
MIAPARAAAYDVLREVSTGAADLPAALALVRERLVDDRDRALAAEIAAGVLRWRAALDHLIVHYAKRPLERLDPEIVEILRLGGYQLLHLTRVPASAAVDDAVSMARRAKKASAAGLVNAVLCAVSRARPALPLPPRPADPSNRRAALAYLAVSLSHPRWLVERWLDRLGFERTERWLQFDNAAGPLTLRANRLRATRHEVAARLADEGVATEPGRFGPDALLVLQGAALRSRAFREGLFVVQDEASQLVPLLAGPAPGPRVLDACASPGGKTTALAALMGDAGLLVACDVRVRRIDLLRRTLAASGAAGVRVVQADLRRSLPFPTLFDTVLVDAPCSGLGTLRRDPDIRWRRAEGDLPSLAAAQLVMLQQAAGVVRPGGRLIYATCSSEPEENEGVAGAFLAGHPTFRHVDARLAAPALAPGLADARGHLRTAPDEHSLEAFFGAIFERTR